LKVNERTGARGESFKERPTIMLRKSVFFLRNHVKK